MGFTNLSHRSKAVLSPRAGPSVPHSLGSEAFYQRMERRQSNCDSRQADCWATGCRPRRRGENPTRPKTPVHDSAGGHALLGGRRGDARMALAFLAGWESDSSSKGFSNVSITGEEEESVAGNRCAVPGPANQPREPARAGAHHVRAGELRQRDCDVRHRVRGRAILELRLREQRQQ
jgi:hypothetical protein